VNELFGSFTRTQTAPIRADQSSYDFLNASAWSAIADARRRMSLWFDRVPPHARRSLRSRLQSRDKRSHQSAFFELAVHEVLTRLPSRVTFEPMIDGLTPDFGVGEDLIVEALVFDPKDSPGADNALEEMVLSSIRDIQSPDHWIYAEFRGEGVRTPRLSMVRTEVLQWHRQLDARDETVHEQHFELAPDWTLELRAAPKSPSSRGRPDHRFVSAGPSRGWGGDGGAAKRMASALRKKARRYGGVGRPLVIAVNCLDVAADGTHTWREALYGPRGLWGSGEPHTHRSVLAVLGFNHLRPWSTTSQGNDYLFVRAGRDNPLPVLDARNGPRLDSHDGAQAKSILECPAELVR